MCPGAAVATQIREEGHQFVPTRRYCDATESILRNKKHTLNEYAFIDYQLYNSTLIYVT